MDPRALIIRLEKPYRDYDASDASEREVVLAGLSSPSDYWAGLAVGWLEQGASIDPEIASALDEVAEKKVFPQDVRHRAFRLARRFYRRSDAA